MPLDTNYLRRRRKKLGLSQARAAAMAEFGTAGRHRWSDLERGRHPSPQLKTLEAIAAALECKITDLLKQ